MYCETKKVERKYKIIVVGAIPPPWGGVEVVTKYVMQSELRREFDLYLFDISKKRGKEYCGRLDWQNLWTALKHFLKLIQINFRKRPDLVYMPLVSHSFGFVRDCIFLIISRLCNRPVVIHIHSNDFDQFYANYNFLEKLIIRKVLATSTKIIVLSKCWYDFFESIAAKDKLKIVYNSVDCELLELLLLKKLSNLKTNKRKTQIIFIGALGKRKGVHDILNAASLLKRKAKFPFIFHLFGPEDVRGELSSLREQWQAENLKDVVLFQGVIGVKEKAKNLLQADMLVLPSYKEGMPLVVLEAFAAGLPVICTSVGAIPEMVKNGKNGFIVNPGDVNSLADCIEKLACDHKLRQYMGAQNSRKFQQEYNLEKSINGIRSIFYEVLNV